MTRYTFLASLLILSTLLVGGCGESDTRSPTIPSGDGPYPELSFGGDTTFDVLTWNVKNFPTIASDQSTYVADVIRSLEPDLVAFQEISSVYVFDQMVAGIAGYDGFVCDSTSYSGQDLAWIWRTSTVTVDDHYDIFESEWEAFPRDPAVMELTFRGVPITLINNHLKAFGDGEIVYEYDYVNDRWDEEYRRLWASNLLDSWVELNAPNDRVIILGDLNDKIDDITSRNVFTTFIDDPDHYRFADMSLAGTPASYSWKLQSHLDHILISDELFGDFEKAGSAVATIRVDLHLENAMSEYQGHVSDHFPVGLSLDLTPEPLP
jgi:endonuclease/exonuclease/phosphatase family metal-dependent hydrolase